MKQLFIISLCIVNSSIIFGMKTPVTVAPSTVFGMSPVPVIPSTATVPLSTHENNLGELIQRYQEQRDEIKNRLLLYENPGIVKTLLTKLEKFCKDHRLSVNTIELKAAARVADDMAKVSAKTATAAAVQLQTYNHPEFPKAWETAVFFQARYLHAKTNKKNVKATDQLISQPNNEENT